MPLLDQNRGIKEYYDEIKDIYPQFTLSQISDMCKAMGEFIKFKMREGTLPFFHIKYLGKFIVKKNKVIGKLKIEHLAFHNNKSINEEYYNNNRAFLTEYLKILKEKDESKEYDDNDND